MDRLGEVDEVAASASRRCTGSLRTSAPLATELNKLAGGE